MVDVRVLGALSVLVDGRPVALSGRRTPGLLALLAARPGRPVSTAEMLRQVWGTPSSQAPCESERNIVQARVSALRRVLGSEVIRATDHGYVLSLPPDAIDAVRFEAAVRQARQCRARSGTDEAAAAYAQALSQWRGEHAYDELWHVPALADEAARLAELRLQILQESLALEVEAGRYDEIAAVLVDATRRHPEVEELWALRMLGLYGQGRQAEAMAVYVEARRQLRDRYGLDPGPRLRELEAMVLHQKDPRRGGLRFLGPTRIARPATSFIGRQSDRERVAELLTTTRLLTLTGAGGVGKTRLAVEAVQALVDSCAPVTAHGVAVLDLIEYREGDDLAGGVLDALGPVIASSSPANAGSGARRSVDVLCDALSDRQLLVILDNCEHLIEDAAMLAAQLLARTTAITVLATSREALNVPGETTYVVAPLPMPSPESDVRQLEDFASVRLLLDRVRSAQPGLDVDEHQLRTVANICRRLDGLPLAMELAAVRIKVLGLDEVSRLLDDRFGLLTEGARTAAERHRTLEAVVEWSYDLLEEHDRLAFALLSVFRGSFAVRQAQRLLVLLGGHSEHAALSRIEHLVSRSMVQVDGPPGAARFRLLETMRVYAAERLRDFGVEKAAHLAHAQVYADLAAELMPALKTERQAETVTRLMREDANIRAAHARAVEYGLGDIAQGLVGALGYIAWMREGRSPRWELVVASMKLATSGPEVAIRALAWATHLGSIFGHPDVAVSYGARMQRLAAQHPECCRAEVGFGLLARAHALHRLGRWDEGDAALRESLAVTTADGDQWTLAGCAMVHGLGALVRGRLDEAEAQFVTAAALYRSCKDRWGQQRAALRRAMVRGARGDHAGAAELLREALDFIDDLDLIEVAAPAKAALARAVLFTGEVEVARRMVAALEDSGLVVRISEVWGRVGQCRAVLAEHDGHPREAAELHETAARRLMDAGLPAEAVDSWACVVRLTGPAGPQARAAIEAAAAAAADSSDPRVTATVLDIQAMMNGDPAVAASAHAVRAAHGLAVPALLRTPPWTPAVE